MGFWGANGHDGIWHIALAESLSKGSLGMPIFSGFKLQNYHIGFDLIIAIIHKITSIPISNLYFQVLPPILSLLIGFLVYRFVSSWTKSYGAAFWSTFFVYFGGSFGFLIGGGESAFWSQQGVSTLINPPFALSLVLLLGGMILLLKENEKHNFWNILFSILCFGVLIEIKVYAGLLALGGLFVAGIFSLIKNHKSSIIKIFIFTLVISILIYLPLNNSSVGLITWQPLWFLEQLMGDRIGWSRFYSAMMTYKSGHILFKGIAAYSVAFAIFLIGNLGTRAILFFKKIKLDPINVFIYSIVTAGIVIPTLFLQKGTSWNTIQFFYYSLFFGSILAGVVISKMKPILIFLLVAATLPTTIIALKDVYVPARPPAMLAQDELSALDFLSGTTDGVVLTYPYDADKAEAAIVNPPRPLYLYTSTAYVAAYGKHQTFLEDEINLDITGYPWQARRDELLLWYKETDPLIARKFLSDNNIKYVYLLRGQSAALDGNFLGLTEIYNNSTVTIYQVEE
jgi:hypothetical protein